jgi:hypothetical protein
MRQSERDELLDRQVQAVETQAVLLRDLLAGIRDRDRRERETRLPAVRHWPSTREPSLFTREVPASHILQAVDRDGKPHRVVLCTCGAQTLLPERGWCECGCGRFFWGRPGRVLVHRFDA